MPIEKIKIHTVVACCNKRGIGNKGALPWHLRKEHKYFSRLTTGEPPEGKQNVVVMGRKTWDSIPAKYRPLKHRYNIVFSRTPDIKFEGADAVVSSLDSLADLLKSSEWKDKIHDLFNVGGSTIYKLIQDSPYCGNIFMSRILADFECDAFFPELGNEFVSLPIEKFPDVPQGVQEENGIEWKVEVFAKQE